MKLFTLISLCLFCINCNANEIIDLQEGLTLAVISNDGKLNTLAVVEDTGRSIKALNISQLAGIDGDIPATYQHLGYRAIADIVLAAGLSQISLYRYEELVSPAGTGRHHIGLGFNYVEHADEINEEHQPFIFLKTVHATREQNIAAKRDALLDYEVEICARPMEPITEKDDVKERSFGFFICGDFTDRAALMRNIDPDDMQSGAGFSDAKSLSGYFPTGPYMVIPKDRKRFLTQVSFGLYRNAVLKQRSEPSKMVWGLETIVEQVFNAHRSDRPTYTNSSDRWVVGDAISTDTVLLTGTPEGVIMRPPSLAYKIIKGTQYILGGAVFRTTLKNYVVENYVLDLLAKKSFLQPEEQLALEGSFMGRIDLTISER